MRLIDADKLRHELIMGHDLIGAKYTDMADTVEAISIKWLCDYAVILAENNYEQAKFIFRLIENYKCELNEDKDKVAIDNLNRMKENWLNNEQNKKNASQAD